MGYPPIPPGSTACPGCGNPVPLNASDVQFCPDCKVYFGAGGRHRHRVCFKCGRLAVGTHPVNRWPICPLCRTAEAVDDLVGDDIQNAARGTTPEVRRAAQHHLILVLLGLGFLLFLLVGGFCSGAYRD